MEQLTDVELHLLEELLGAQELAIAKAGEAADRLHDEPLRRVAREALQLHRRQFDELLRSLHEFSGGLARPEGSPS